MFERDYTYKETIHWCGNELFLWRICT